MVATRKKRASASAAEEAIANTASKKKTNTAKKENDAIASVEQDDDIDIDDSTQNEAVPNVEEMAEEAKEGEPQVEAGSGDEASPDEEPVEKKKEETVVEEMAEHVDADKQMDNEENDVLPVEDTSQHVENGKEEEDGEKKQDHDASSDEEGVVKGETAPARVSKEDIGDEDDDEIVKIENELSSNSRYDGIDAGTKKRLAVVLEYARVQPKDLETRVLDQLKSLSKADTKEALKMLDHSVRTSKIRNLSAYFSSMLRRMASGPKATEGREVRNRGTISELDPQAKSILEDLYDTRNVREGDLDGRALSLLAEKPKDVQILIMQTFSSRKFSGVRNMAAYFMSHMNQVEDGLKSGKYRLPHSGVEPRRPVDRSQLIDHHPNADHHQRKHYEYVPTSQRHVPPYMSTQYEPSQAGSYPTMPPAAPPASIPDTPAKHYALEQVQWGVRVDEFQALSAHAKFVHPAAALRLQQLWDLEQNKLVSVLDDHSWLLLAGLDAPNSVKAVNEVAERMKTAPDDLTTVNRIFVEVASKYPRRDDAPPLPTSTLPHGMSSYTNPVYDHRTIAASAHSVQLPGPAGQLPPRVQAKIDEILGNPKWYGNLTLDQFDDRVVGMLKVDERLALTVLADFDGSDPQKIRNPGAYLVGCLRNATNPAARMPHDTRGPGGRSGGSRGRGRGRHPDHRPTYGGRGGNQRYTPY